MRSVLIICILSTTAAAAGELDLDLGVQATTTPWQGDHGGGTVYGLGYWFLPWIGVTYLGKEQYATIDDRFLIYFSLNVAGRQELGPLRLTGTLGLVHEHEEPRAAVDAQPLEAVFGVGDGIRHRMAGRAGAQVALPVWDYGRGTMFVALDVDFTKFMDMDKGPSWMTSAGVSLGATYDFHRGAK
jgi:hypothetical protein